MKGMKLGIVLLGIGMATFTSEWAMSQDLGCPVGPYGCPDEEVCYDVESCRWVGIAGKNRRRVCSTTTVCYTLPGICPPEICIPLGGYG